MVVDSYNGQHLFKMSWLATLAFAVGSARYIVGRRRTSLDEVIPEEVQITLKKEGTVLINQIVDQGCTIRSGNIIICGALGEVHPAAPGRDSADYGPLGGIDFELR